MVKNGYWENGVLNFVWDLGVNFSACKIGRSVRFFKKMFLILGLKAVIEKCVVCLLAYLF